MKQTAGSPERRIKPRLSVIVLTYNRASLVLGTVGRLLALPDRVDIVVVDNGSSDGTPEQIADIFPSVTLVRAPSNLGAAGRNLGVARVTTEYIAFCDDDTWWHPGSLTRAIELLDAHPRVALLSARVVVGESDQADATCELMQRSPLDSRGLPGPALIGYMAGASVFRTAVFHEVGGYEPRLFIGGEEELVALDILANGHALVYANELILHHHPSPLRDSALRRRMLARNAAWVAWLRLPAAEAWRRTVLALACMRHEGTLARDAVSLLRAFAWAMKHRRVIPADVQRMRTRVRDAEARAGLAPSPTNA
jgi:GT2 family glycosyltransferase